LEPRYEPQLTLSDAAPVNASDRIEGRKKTPLAALAFYYHSYPQLLSYCDFSVVFSHYLTMIQKELELNRVEIQVSRKVLVVGTGLISQGVIHELIEMGYEVISTYAEDRAPEQGHLSDRPSSMPIHTDGVEVLGPTELVRFGGDPGRFNVSFKIDGARLLEKDVGAVILATDCELDEDLDAWKIECAKRVSSVSRLITALDAKDNGLFLEKTAPLTCVFVCGFTHSSNPYSLRKAINASLGLVSEANARVIFLMEHLEVADYGMERLTHKARDAGILFVRLSGTRPEIKSIGQGLRVSYIDEILGDEVQITPDLVVFEEAYRPPKGASQIADVLGIHLDRRGFFQGDNVYNRPIFTNRAGIWVVGSANGPISLEEGLKEAKAAALEVSKLLGDGTRRVEECRAGIIRRRCSACLTCFRVCPHGAVSFNDRRPIFSALACKGCGICVAECPMGVIQLHDFNDDELKAQIPVSSSALNLVAFTCQNSAFEAWSYASMMGLPLPAGLKVIRVPCAGRVGVDLVLSAFKAGVDGVMVLACHHESCKSVSGSLTAEERIKGIKGLLEKIGLEDERLIFAGIGPGMAFDFVKTAQEMEKTVLSLGKRRTYG